mgnify:CR=1 FL=1
MGEVSTTVTRYKYVNGECVEDPNGEIVVTTVRPVLTDEERQMRLDALANTLSSLLGYKISISRKTDKRDVL